MNIASADVVQKYIDSDFLLYAYRNGYFPMADGKDGEIFWYSPDARGIFPLDALIISRSLRRTLQKNIFEIRINSAFKSVLEQCAVNREVTWISETIVQSYVRLHQLGYAHSVETWHNDTLVGGLYGVALGGAFFGESMFSTMTDASKVALVALTKRLQERHFVLLDTQYITPHLQSLGAIEISKEEYMRKLSCALAIQTSFI